MNKPDSQKRVQAIRDYLEAVGSPVSSVQGHEILARALGYKNKHVLNARLDSAGLVGSSEKATAPLSTPASTPLAASLPAVVELDGTLVRVMGLCEEHLTVEKMRELDWTFDLVLPFPLEKLGDIDDQNDFASKCLTGHDHALQAIGYAHVADINYGEGYVAMRITGFVTSPEDFFDEELADSDKRFYADLAELVQCVQLGARVNVSLASGPYAGHLDFVDPRAHQLLLAYALGHGDNNEEVNDHLKDIVFKAVSGGNCLAVTVDELKYATRASGHRWNTHIQGSAELVFCG